MTRKHYRPEQKIEILRELLENQTPMSELCDRYGVSPQMVYQWKKQLFEGGLSIFSRKSSTEKHLNAKIEKLEHTLKIRDNVISELASENIRYKKKLNGDD